MGLQNLTTIVRSCQLGEVISRVLTKTGIKETQRIATYNVSKESKLHQAIPELFSGAKSPKLQYGYTENAEKSNTFFVNILDGDNIIREMKYKQNSNGTLSTNFKGTKEHINCEYDPKKSLFNLNNSGIDANSGAMGVPQGMVDLSLNLNNALILNGRIEKSRLGKTIESKLTTEGRFCIQRGINGTPDNTTNIVLDYHGTNGNLNIKDRHLAKMLLLLLA